MKERKSTIKKDDGLHVPESEEWMDGVYGRFDLFIIRKFLVE